LPAWALCALLVWPSVLPSVADDQAGALPQGYLTVDDDVVDRSAVSLLPHAHVLRDPGGELDFERLLAAERSPEGAGFQPLGDSFSMGFTGDAFWLRLALARAPESSDEVFWLVAWPPFIDDLRLYAPTADGGYAELSAGDHVPVAERMLALRETVFQIRLGSEPRVFYVRARSGSTLTLALELLRPQVFVERSVFVNTRHGLFFGLLLTSLVVSLLCALWLRQRFFFIATAYLLSYGVLHFILNGYDQLLIYPAMPWLADSLIGVFGALTGGLLIHFVLSYLEPRAFYPRLTLLLTVLAWWFYVMTGLSIVGLYPQIAFLFHLSATLVLVLMPVLFLLMLPHRRQRAALMLIIFLPSVIAVLLQGLRNLGLLPTVFWTTHLWELSSFLQMPFAAVVVLLRVREEERRHRHAQEREAAQRGFLRMIAHELRTPLSVIDTAVANLEARTEAIQPELRPRYRRIQTALARLNTLVDNALTEDRLQDGSIEPDLEPVTPSQLAAQVLELLDIDEGMHPLDVGLPEDDRPIAMDPHWMGLAVLNLLDNAVKYSPKGGPIGLRIERGDGMLHIRVSDRGIGIRSADAEQLFHRFFRAEDARKLPGVTGLGIGLYLVQQVVERHGGRVSVDSRPGTGSTFTLSIPETMRIDGE
ncbi:MAG: sensor histidine kinase, partial [Chromatiales bacterium]|nr:sensor histidine kinase [Chromatiales bacterium]